MRLRQVSKNRSIKLLLAICILLLIACESMTIDESLVGTKDDVRYAGALWSALVDNKLVGANAVHSKPFFGGANPHGMILEVDSKVISLRDHDGFVVVKKNYSGEGVSVTNVEAQREKYLNSVTVMYQRESGYDDDNQDWFWVKYLPSGEVAKKTVNKKSVMLAGRLLKGRTPDQSMGCINCHRSAGGGDYIFYPDIHVPPVESALANKL